MKIVKYISIFMLVLFISITGFPIENISAATTPVSSLSFDGVDDYILLNNLSVNTATDSKNTVEFMMKWDGTNAVMPFSWDGAYDLYINDGMFGFNTGNGDILGVSFSSYVNKWVHVTAIFNNGIMDGSKLKIYLDGSLQTLSQVGTPVTTAKTVTSSARLSGWNISTTFKFSGAISDLTIWNYERTPAQIVQDTQSVNPSEIGLVGLWRMDPTTTRLVYDQTSYKNNATGFGFSPPSLNVSQDMTETNPSGVRKSVLTFDSNNINKTIYRNGVSIGTTTSTVYTDQNISGGSPNRYNYKYVTSNGESIPSDTRYYGDEGLSFDGQKNYYTLDSNLNFGTGDFTVETRVKFNSLSTLSQIFSKRIDNLSNLELQVHPDGMVEVGIGDQNAGYVSLCSNRRVTDTSYHFYGVVRQGTFLALYIDGVLDSSMNTSTVVNITNTSPWFVGSDIFLGEFLNGSISEMRFWSKARSSQEIQSTLNTGLAGNEPNLEGLYVLNPVTNYILYDMSAKNEYTGYGHNFSPIMSLTASNISDLGMDISIGSSISEVTGYEFYRNGTHIYTGLSSTYNEGALVSDSDYTYELRGLNPYGSSVGTVQTFHTLPGELALITLPTNFTLSNVQLNGNKQTSYGTFNNKLIVKDTRKVRNGWRLFANSTTLTNGVHTFSKGSVNIKPAASVVQTNGSYQTQPQLVATQTQAIDNHIPLNQAKVLIIKPTTNETCWAPWFQNNVPDTTLVSDISTIDVTTAKMYDLIVYDLEYWGIPSTDMDKLKSFTDAGVSVIATANDTETNVFVDSFVYGSNNSHTITILNNDYISSFQGSVYSGNWDNQRGIQTLKNGAAPLFKRDDNGLISGYTYESPTSGALLMFDQEGDDFFDFMQQIAEIGVNRTVKNLAKVSPLASANADTGQGYYEITLPSNALELSIMPESYTGNYSTNITWTLVPGAN